MLHIPVMLGSSEQDLDTRNTHPAHIQANVFFQPLGCDLQDWEAQLLQSITVEEEHHMMGAKHCAWKREYENTARNLLVCLTETSMSSAARPPYRLWLRSDSIFWPYT